MSISYPTTAKQREAPNLVSDKWIPNPRPFPTRPPHEWPAAMPVPPAEEEAAPEPEQSPSEGKLGMILGVIGVALVAAIVTYVVLRVIRPPKHKVAAPVTTTLPQSSTTTTLPAGPNITAVQLSQLTDQLVPFVERTRQLTFTTHPIPVLENDVTYSVSLREYLTRSKGLMNRLSAPFEVLGLNSNDADMDRAPQAFQGPNTVAFYDTVRNVIHVRAVPATPYLSTMLVVGLTEQLDDQHFTTDQIAAPTAYGDGAFGLMTLVGGDAWRVASAWAGTQSVADQTQIQAELKARRGADADTSQVPSALAAWLRYPADDGVNFVSDLVTSTSSSPLNSVFRNPPDGSAQVLSPARVAAKINQLPVTPAKVDGKVESTGTFGRFFLESTLTTLVPDDVLQLALNGYRGDTMVTYTKSGSGSCVAWRITTGTASPENMRKAVGAFAAKRNGTMRLVADPARAGRKLVELDMCSGGGGGGDSDSSPTTTTTTTPGSGSGTNPSTTLPGGPLP